MIMKPSQSKRLAAGSLVQRRRGQLNEPRHAISLRRLAITVNTRQAALFFLFVAVSFAGLTDTAFAHENQVVEYGSFLAGLSHPVLGLDHFLAMVSVGIVSALIGGRAIWIVPSTFVVLMGVGAAAGYADLGLSSTIIETGIAVSVILLGGVILLDRSLDVRIAMGFVAFFGFFHGYAHGAETPDIAGPVVYALGFLLGTILIHLLGLLIGEVAIRYTYGRTILRGVGGVFMLIGALFILGVL